MYEIIKELKYKRDSQKEQLTKNKELTLKKEVELKDLLNDIENHSRAYKELEKIINVENKVFVKQIEALLNKGIKTIFFDEDYDIHVILNEKKICFELTDNNNLNDDDEPIRINIEDAAGGGVLTVVGFILQIYIIQIMGLHKVIFVDEGFMALSSTYRPIFYNFLRELSGEIGLKILLISHDQLVEEYATQVFTISHGKIMQ